MPTASSNTPRGAASAEDASPRVDSGPRPLIRWRGWRPALWSAAVVAVALTWAVTFVVSAYQTLLHAGVCHEPAGAADLTEAQRALVLLALVVVAPWVVASWRSRYRLRVGLFALLAVAPAICGAVQVVMSTTADFTLEWCLY